MRQLKGIVIHRAEVTFANREYHYLVNRDGSVTQLNDDSISAPHAKNWNPSTLGIAVFGDFASGEHSRNGFPTDKQYEATAKLCRELRSKYGELWIKGHTDLGPSGTTFPEKLTEAFSCPGTAFCLDYLRDLVNGEDLSCFQKQSKSSGILVTRKSS